MKKILLADDETFALIGLEKLVNLIAPVDSIIITATNGKEAVSKAEKLEPDIVILDIDMPILSGIEAAKIIKRENPDCKILFLTAYNKFEYAVSALRIPAEDYLLKPVRESELKAKFLSAIQDSCDKYEKIEKEKSSFRKKVETYIEMNYSRDLAQDEIAGIVGQNPSYFSRSFKNEFNQTFTDYLTEYRISKSKSLLSDSDFTIKEIAEICGYKDSNYFSKVFRKYTGEAPSEYKLKVQFDK